MYRIKRDDSSDVPGDTAAEKTRKGSSRQVSWSESVQSMNSAERQMDEAAPAYDTFKTPRIGASKGPPESPSLSPAGSPGPKDSLPQEGQGEPAALPVQGSPGISPDAVYPSRPRGDLPPSPIFAIGAYPPSTGYHFPKSNIPSHQAQLPGSSPYFSPPVPWLPTHMRRGQKSIPHSSSPSMLQEVFSAANSPVDLGPASRLTTADHPKTGGEIAHGPGEPRQGEESLENLLFDGRTRVKTAYINWNPQMGGVTGNFPAVIAWHLDQASSPKDAEAALSDLLHVTTTGEGDQNWISALAYSERLLKHLFRLCDLVTPVNSLLDPNSPCAEIIDLLLEHGDIDYLLPMVCRPDRNGATGLRYLICQARSMGNPAGEPPDIDSKAAWTLDTAAYHAYQIIYMSGADSQSSIPAIRLFESILSGVRTLDQLQRPIYRSFLEAVIHLIKRKGHVRQGEPPEVDPARRTAALHLISSTLRTYTSLLHRLEADSETPTMPKEEWILQTLGIADIVPYLHDEKGHPLVRCMALRVLRDFADVDVEEVSRWEKLEDTLSICVDVLLWKTKWQHSQEPTCKSLCIAKFCPHDDAYRIMASSPPQLVIPALARGLKADDKSTLLEPIISLIVDHSTLKDKYWPFMLSILLHSGCLSLFHDILQRPVPPEKDFRFRTSCRAKAEACIGLTRSFEQMRAKDIKTIPSNIGLTLAKLANDEKLPLNLRGRANDAFEALKE